MSENKEPFDLAKSFSSFLNKDEKVIKPKIESKFVGEEVKEEVIKKEEPKRDVNKEIDSLLKKMLPQSFGKVEEEVLERFNEETPIEEIKEETQPEQTIFNKLRKKESPSQKVKGLEGVEYVDYSKYPIKFMPSLPRFELKHKDHSNLIIAKECFRKYFYSAIICLNPKEATNIFYPWGTSYHIFRQRLNEHYGYGEHEPKKLDFELAKKAFKESSREATQYWMDHGEDQKPNTRLDWFTTDRLYKSLVKAYEHWIEEKKKGQIKVLAVEQFFTIQLLDGSFSQGRIDEAVLYNNELWGRDFKTTSKPREWFTKSLKPNNQVRTYTFGNSKLAGRKCRGIIIQAMYNGKGTKKGDKGPDIYEELVECSDYELEQWEVEQEQWNKLLEVCRENDVWPQTEKNCQWCNYQLICSKPTEASMLYTLENKYERRLRDPARMDQSED